MTKASSFVLKFIRKEQRAKDTFSFYFDRSHTKFDFRPGQYLRLTLPHKSDDRGTSRFFTISSSPLEKEIMITAKILQSSFKERLFSLKKKDEVHIFGPMGRFTLDEESKKEHVFIAGGIGVTPFHSMISYAAATNHQNPITLFAMFSNYEDVLFHDVFQSISKLHPSIKVIYSVTKSHPLWKGEQGRVSKTLVQKYIQHHSQVLYSVVGSPAMVAETRQLLASLGIPEESIRSEGFTGY